MSDEELKRHIAKMETIHGDEPIRIKMALAWAKEVLELRRLVEALTLMIECERPPSTTRITLKEFNDWCEKQFMDLPNSAKAGQ